MNHVHPPITRKMSAAPIATDVQEIEERVIVSIVGDLNSVSSCVGIMERLETTISLLKPSGPAQKEDIASRLPESRIRLWVM
jgi:hypothetical protein